MRDSVASEPLGGTSVLVKGKSAGATADHSGKFNLHYESDSAEKIISLISFCLIPRACTCARKESIPGMP